MNYKEIKKVAISYADYCVTLRMNQSIPMDFDDWYENQKKFNDNKYEEDIDHIIIFLNYVSRSFGKRGFQSKGKKIRSLIRTKLKEGFTIDDFKNVIQTKSKWLSDEKMHKYFRPVTLFGNKFEDYLNESSQPIKQSTDDKLARAYQDGFNDSF